MIKLRICDQCISELSNGLNFIDIEVLTVLYNGNLSKCFALIEVYEGLENHAQHLKTENKRMQQKKNEWGSLRKEVRHEILEKEYQMRRVYDPNVKKQIGKGFPESPVYQITDEQAYASLKKMQSMLFVNETHGGTLPTFKITEEGKCALSFVLAS